MGFNSAILPLTAVVRTKALDGDLKRSAAQRLDSLAILTPQFSELQQSLYRLWAEAFMTELLIVSTRVVIGRNVIGFGSCSGLEQSCLVGQNFESTALIRVSKEKLLLKCRQSRIMARSNTSSILYAGNFANFPPSDEEITQDATNICCSIDLSDGWVSVTAGNTRDGILKPTCSLRLAAFSVRMRNQVWLQAFLKPVKNIEVDIKCAFEKRTQDHTSISNFGTPR